MKQWQNNEAFRAFNFAVQLVLEALKPRSFSTINGIFDENMKTCVQEFQKENSLTVDGIVGGDTLEKILKLVTKN